VPPTPIPLPGRVRAHVTLSALLLAAQAGCSAAPGAAAEEATAAIRDSAGVAIVEYRGQPSAPTITLEPRPFFTLGQSDGADTAAQFSRIGGAIRLGNGTVVVQEGKSETRWFDSTGRHLRTTTRSGNGPGEIRSVESLLRMPGDSVLVAGGSYGFMKQVTFTADGTLAHEHVLDFERYRQLARFGECRAMTFPDRSRLACVPIPSPDPARRGADPGPGYLRKMDRLFRVPVTLDRAYPMGLGGGIVQTGIRVGNGTAFIIHPFGAWTAVAAGGWPMRVAIATGPAYEVELWSQTGALERIVRRLDGRRALTDADRAEHQRRLQEWVQQRERSTDPALMVRVLEEIPAPDSMPAIGSMALAPDGTLFVTRAGRFSPEQPTQVDVFDAQATFLATLQLPPRFHIFDAGTDYLLGVRYNEDDVPVIEIYRMRRAAP
jgi:hypothetical protein